MRIITRTRLVDFWCMVPTIEGPMRAWEVAVKAAIWTCPNDVKQTFRNADWAYQLWIFDVNRCRIIADVQYQFTTPSGAVIPGKVFLKEVLTHPDYDRWTAAMMKREKK